MIIRDLILAVIGIISGILLFCRFPIIKKGNNPTEKKVSIVIPCRNEQNNIRELLESLRQQRTRPYEIICVDDQSTDQTASVIRSFNEVKLVSVEDKPEDWNGKPYALTVGAKAATGDVLLFLDADVKLESDGLTDLFSAYENKGNFSCHPYHKTKKCGESFALFFNMLSVAGTGITLPKPIQKGMFGPVLMVDKEIYFAAGAHENVRNSIIEDYDLGKHYKNKKIPYTLYLGNKAVSFRMYPEGIKSQAQGFIKNFSKGAISAGIISNLLTALYITGITLVFIQAIIGIASLNLVSSLVFGGMYIFLAGHLFFVSSRLGRFNPLVCVFYFLPLIWFILIFLISIFAKVFHLNVVWKGRKIKP